MSDQDKLRKLAEMEELDTEVVEALLDLLADKRLREALLVLLKEFKDQAVRRCQYSEGVKVYRAQGGWIMIDALENKLYSIREEYEELIEKEKNDVGSGK